MVQYSSIADFYANKEIFITGGTGFMGRVLIEKIARSCPKFKAIYVLLRTKKNTSIEERLDEIKNLPLFEKLRNTYPENLNKIHAINGDCLDPLLGISDIDLKRLENVSIIFHSAASVRFDDPIRDSIFMNTRSTYETVKFAKTLKNLQVFVHVSTAYSNPDKFEIEEKVYPPYTNWRTAIQIAESYNDDILEPLNVKYRSMLPNTYTFTKNLAEDVINDFKDELPCVIYRPTIVIASLNDPIPGWIDNLNGPTAILLACGLGLLNTRHGDPDIENDYIPVDMVIKGLILAGYNKGISNEPNKLEVYNCSMTKFQKISGGYIITLGKKLVAENPLESAIVPASGTITKCKFWHLLRLFIFELAIAIGLDTVMRITKVRKPFLLKLQRKIVNALYAVSYFVDKEWNFDNVKFCALDELIPTQEYEDFSFYKDRNYDLVKYYSKSLIGIKLYLLKEPAIATSECRRRYKILLALQYSFLAFVAWIGYKIIFSSILPLIKSWIN